MKRLWGVLLACVLTVSCTVLPANAVGPSDAPPAVSRISGQLNHRIPANNIGYIGGEIFLDRGESITYTCVYTPKSASVDFGYVDADGFFHIINSTNGSIDETIEIEELGQYRLAIRNNDSRAVTVTGTVKY